MSDYSQLNHDRLKQKEIKTNPTQHNTVQEYRQNPLESSYGTVLIAYLITFIALGILLTSSFLIYKKKKKNSDAKSSKK
ncbi:MAG: LPXTG cell wall anchor domain-containing protein [Rickettsia endosymbiont of Argas persicus]